MMMRLLINTSVLFLLFGLQLTPSLAFCPKRNLWGTDSRHLQGISRIPVLRAITEANVESLSKPEQKVFNLVEDLHKSGYSFRVVVVGNGAILETTSELGPVMKLNQSPKTGEALLTLASQDKSFEFHLKTAKVSKVALTEKEAATGKVMRVIRFLNTAGEPICSLILRDDSDDATAWYSDLRSTYGTDVQL